jgi:uridine kinase
VGIAGGTGSGKSWLAQYLSRALCGRAAVITQDWYYKDRSRTVAHRRAALNFDHPRAFDHALLGRHLDALRRGSAIDAPQYEYRTHSRAATTVRIEAAPVVLIEGILVLHDPDVRRRLDHAIFVDVPADVRLMRRLRRDAGERGLPTAETLRLYEKFARPMHERFVEGSSARAVEIWRPLEDRRFPRRLADALKRRISK